MIYYLVTDNSKPSWGVGIIYHHVSILVKYGYSAIVLHNSPGFKIGWLDLNLQISYFSEVLLNMTLQNIPVEKYFLSKP